LPTMKLMIGPRIAVRITDHDVSEVESNSARGIGGNCAREAHSREKNRADRYFEYRATPTIDASNNLKATGSVRGKRSNASLVTSSRREHAVYVLDASPNWSRSV
jgi:hypothetical protein